MATLTASSHAHIPSTSSEVLPGRIRVILDRLLPGGTVLLDSPSVHTSDPLRPSGRKRSGHLGCSVVPPSEPASSHQSHVLPEDAGTRNLAGPLTRTISELYDHPVPVL